MVSCSNDSWWKKQSSVIRKSQSLGYRDTVYPKSIVSHSLLFGYDEGYSSVYKGKSWFVKKNITNFIVGIYGPCAGW